jgi:hypothetical protein
MQHSQVLAVGIGPLAARTLELLRELYTMEKNWYVYTLAYPESMGGVVFYVGKGCGNRIDRHEREAKNGGTSYKCRVIYEILADGEQIVKTILACFATDKESRVYEAALIFFMDGLTNLSWDAGMPVARGGVRTHRPIVHVDPEVKKQNRIISNQKVSIMKKGKKRSEEALRKQSESMKRHFEERQRRMETEEYQKLKKSVRQSK